MPAGLETFTDGSAAFFSARETPWHKLGTVTAGTLSAEEAIRVAKLDWTVTKQPVYAELVHEADITADGPEYVERVRVPGKFATARIHPETGKLDPLGIVGNVYVPFQNLDTAMLLDAIVEQGGANIETMGSLQNGRRVFACIKLPGDVTVGGRDVLDQFLVVDNSHDGSSHLRGRVTPIRAVCTNTIELGRRLAIASFDLRHTYTNMAEAANVARQALGVTNKFAEEFRAIAEKLVSEPMTQDEFGKFIDKVYEPTEDSKGKPTAGTLNRRDALFGLWVSETQANIAGTRWAAYNAVVEYADWIAPVRGGVEGRATRIALGDAASPKAIAAELLLGKGSPKALVSA